MIFYWSKNHLDSHACPKDLSIPNFIETGAKSQILDFFMVFGFHSNNKVSLYDLLLVKNHLDSYPCPKDLSIPNFIEIRAKSWILDFFMTFGFHSNNKVSLFDLVLV